VNGVGSPELRTAVVLVGDQRLRRRVVRCVEGRDQRAVEVASVPHALSRALGTDVTAVVVGVDHHVDDGWVDLALVLAHLRPDVSVLVGHVEGDIETMWRAFRCGATPWTIPSAGQRRLGLPTFGERRSLGGRVVLDALERELSGHPTVACSLLTQITDGEVEAAIEALIGTGAAALVHLRDRARYATPIEVLLSHLPNHGHTSDREALTRCWATVEAMAFRASGLRLEVPDLTANDREALFGAFHATVSVVRFIARRRWRRPADVLHEFVNAGWAGTPLEPDCQRVPLIEPQLEVPSQAENKPVQLPLDVTG